MSITGPQSVTSSASLIDSFPDFVAEMASHYVFETNFLGRRFKETSFVETFITDTY